MWASRASGACDGVCFAIVNDVFYLEDKVGSGLRCRHQACVRMLLEAFIVWFEGGEVNTS